MKKVIKLIIQFFIKLFKKKQKAPVITTRTYSKDELNRDKKPKNQPINSVRNHRKKTKGRPLQEVKYPNGSSRFIQHTY